MSSIIDDVKKLKLPIREYVVVGGSALAARGIRESDDIDLIVTSSLYVSLKKDGWEEKEKNTNHFHLYKYNAEAAKDFSHIDGCRLTTEDVIRNAEIIGGVPVMSLEDLIELKRAMGRDKDQRDIELIHKYQKDH